MLTNLLMSLDVVVLNSSPAALRTRSIFGFAVATAVLSSNSLSQRARRNTCLSRHPPFKTGQSRYHLSFAVQASSPFLPSMATAIILAARKVLQTCQKAGIMPAFDKIIVAVEPASVGRTSAAKIVAAVVIKMSGRHSCFRKPHTFQSLGRTSGTGCRDLGHCVLHSIRFVIARPFKLAFKLTGPFGPASMLISELESGPASSVIAAVVFASSDVRLRRNLAVGKAGMNLKPALRSSINHQRMAGLTTVLPQLLAVQQVLEAAWSLSHLVVSLLQIQSHLTFVS